MAYKHFRLNVILRVAGLGLSIAAFVYSWGEPSWLVTKVILAGLIVMLLLDLIRYLERTNRDLSNFLLSIKYEDFSSSFPASRRGRSFASLRDAFHDISQVFQRLKAEKESHYQYMQTVIEHVGVALLSYNEQGEIQLMNQAAQRLLHKPYMKNIEALELVDPVLPVALTQLRTGQRSLVKTIIDGEPMQLALAATEFKLGNEQYKLVSLTNIKGELDAKELDSYQQLIRVLTHEIMNSITPVVSLTECINQMMEQKGGEPKPMEELDEEDVEDIREGLKTIEKRSKGLLKFVNAYRSFTKIPTPNLTTVSVKDLLSRVRRLMDAQLKERGIGLEVNVLYGDMTIQADPELIEPVLINLVKNAMEAFNGREGEKVTLNALYTKDQRPMIQVEDNGAGIPDEFLDKIFVPFFTTKKEGSGIGLSLARQVMKRHGGTISVQTEDGEGAVFSLVF